MSDLYRFQLTLRDGEKRTSLGTREFIACPRTGESVAIFEPGGKGRGYDVLGVFHWTQPNESGLAGVLLLGAQDPEFDITQFFD